MATASAAAEALSVLNASAAFNRWAGFELGAVDPGVVELRCFEQAAEFPCEVHRTRACTAPCSSKKRWRPSGANTPSCQMSGWM